MTVNLLHDMRIATLVLLVLTLCPSAAQEWTSLFDGKSLNCWEGNTDSVWRVEDGIIVGGSMSGNPQNEFLSTTKTYKNFRLKLEYKLIGTEGFVNGGVQIRSRRIKEPAHEMIGYQADIGAGYSGFLYDESRRKKMLAKVDAELVKKIERTGDWNTYEIHAHGRTVTLSINGQRLSTWVETDKPLEQKGLIALQIHGDCKAVISFRNIMIDELPDTVAATSPNSQRKPNFVIIFTDDQGYGDLGCFGSTTIKTPHIDRMAQGGRKFTNFMVPQPLCTPSRASLLTASYPRRVGMHEWVLFPQSNKGLNPNRAHHRRLLEGSGLRHSVHRQVAPRSPP